MKLTANQIRYLLTIKQLNETRHVIKSVDIANELDVSRSSVHKMLTSLKELNCIRQERYSTLSLTAAGNRAGCDCLKKYERIKEQLSPLVSIEKDFDLGICTLIEEM